MVRQRAHPARVSPRVGDHCVIDRAAFRDLIAAIAGRGYRVIGPTMRDGAIVYDEVSSDADLPAGWTDEQGPGHYRLNRRPDEALFGFAVGPHSWKRWLYPPRLRLWQAQKHGSEFRMTAEAEAAEAPKYAFLGVRACELHAIAIQDRVLLGGTYTDPTYRQRREGACIIAVNCAQAGGTCFCASMGTGPRVDADFDLCLTEVIGLERHAFVVEVGTELGAQILGDVPCTPAGDDDLHAVERIVADTTAHMGRTLDAGGIHDLLMANLDHPRWDQVATRCLSCGNCTLVCPTCFCTSVEDTTDLSGDHAERNRRWDSCFTADFSYIAGGPVRASTRSRYRQWMTHKLATWIDQFGTSGCVGCGRCITWCPVGIDITEEAQAMAASASGQPSTTKEP